MCEPNISKVESSSGQPDRKDSINGTALSDLDMECPAVTKQMSLALTKSHEGVCNRVASARSSGASSAYYSSTSSCFDFPLTPVSTPVTVTKRRTRLCCEQDLSSIFAEDKEEEEENNQASVQPPSLKMIRRLKRMSDAWSHVSKCSENDDEIIDRLKKGREEAMRRQIYIEELLNDASSQYHIQRQAKSVLMVCSDNLGMDDVEAERIILLAGERYKAYHEEAERIVSELGSSICDTSGMGVAESSVSPATLYISDIKLKLSDDFIASLQASSNNHAHYFLCLLREKMTKGIIATQILSIPGQSDSQTLHCTNLLTLLEIPPNFILEVEIYHMSSETKHRNKKRVLSRVLSSVKRVPSISRHSYLLCTRTSTDDEEPQPIAASSKEELIPSEFLHAGHVVITRASLRQPGPYMTSNNEIVCSLELVVNADPLYTQAPLEGFLNYYHLKAWERRWFVLNNTSLSCWLCQEHQEKEAPLQEWDISDCYKTVTSASPIDCDWNYGLLLTLSSNEEVLLATETSLRVDDWISALNSIILCNSEWRTL